MNRNRTSPPIFDDAVSAPSSGPESPGAVPGTVPDGSPDAASEVSSDVSAQDQIEDLGALPADHPLTVHGTAASALLRACRGEQVDRHPVWFMRQAGRSLPEYREARAGIGMLEACLRPDLAAEITCQPVRRHGVDAGIFFSDIVVPLRIAGVGVEIVPGTGPVVEHPIRTSEDVDRLVSTPLPAGPDDPLLAPIRDAVRLSVGELRATPLIGFCGAPFTVASYLIEGGPSRDHLATRAMMRSAPEQWARLASWVADLSGVFLRAQVLAGASAVQVFDSWAGALSRAAYARHAAPATAQVISHVADLPVPRIGFGVHTSDLLGDIRAAGATVIGVDHRLPLDEATRRLGDAVPLQGNIDPAVLFATDQVRREEVRDVIARGARAPGHVVNLGHGVPKNADPGVLTHLVELVHAEPVPERTTKRAAPTPAATTISSVPSPGASA